MLSLGWYNAPTRPMARRDIKFNWEYLALLRQAAREKHDYKSLRSRLRYQEQEQECPNHIRHGEAGVRAFFKDFALHSRQLQRPDKRETDVAFPGTQEWQYNPFTSRRRYWRRGQRLYFGHSPR